MKHKLAIAAVAVAIMAAAAPAQAQRWHGHGGWHGGHGWGWGAGAGFAAGSLLGGAIAANQGYYYGPGVYGYGYDYGPDYAYEAAPVYEGGGSAYCAQRYRSYDPASGTFLGYDGLRHPCP
jgi:opacity protein-like surface antigen